MPRVTIITPVFNGIRYISECVGNVALQGVADLEHLVIDGGSTDGTAERLYELAEMHPHLRVISEKDKGQSDAMNKGVRLAKGEIIGFLNVDDFYEPGAVRDAMDYLRRHPSIDFVAGNCQIIDENGKFIHLNRPRDLRLESILLGEPMPQNPSAYFYRKSIHAIVGEYDVSEHYTLDLIFVLNCAAKVRMAYTPRLWGNMRMMPGTKTYNDSKSGTAPVRRKELISLWLSRLSPAQRRRMYFIRNQIRLGKTARRYFGEVGRRLMRLMPPQAK